MKKANILLLVGLLFGLVFAGRLAAQVIPASASSLIPPPSSFTLPHFWLTTRLTSPSQIYGLGDNSLALDTAGQPHILYGKNSLYYTWRDESSWHQEYLNGVQLYYSGLGQSSALALDGANTAHIAYVNKVPGQHYLSYASRKGGRWSHAALEAITQPYLPTITLDDAGYPHIAYASYEADVGKVHYLYQTEQGWFSHAFTTGDALKTLALAVDAAGQPHLAYVANDGLLHYATWNGSEWQVETVQTVADYTRSATSIAVDSQGRPAIAYQSNSGIRYTSRSDQGWTLEALNNDTFGVWLSLALDNQDVPHLAYYDSHQDRQMYATRPAATWIITVVDNDTDTGHFTDIALDQQGQPHFSYAYYPAFQPGYEYQSALTVRYAHLTGGQWLTETASAGNFHQRPSLAVASDDYLHLVYKDYYSWQYAHETPDGWATETIPMSPPHPNASASFILDAADNPRIAYYDSEMTLHYAYRTNDTWASQPVTTSVGTPFLTVAASLALDNNETPHLAYYHLFQNELHYAYLSGEEWVFETVATADASPSLDLALDSLNQPHLVYRDSGDVKYARRLSGQWLIETVDEGSAASLILDSQDNPHLLYRYSSQVVYAHWTGSDWTYQVIDEVTNNSLWNAPSLALDQYDQPYVAYLDYGDALKFARLDGNSWFIHQVDSQLDAGNYPSLALNSQGMPFILHQDRLNGHIKLSRPAAAVTYAPLITKP